jgi:hypothetical protein
MPTPPDNPQYFDEEEFGPDYPVPTYEGYTQRTLLLPVGTLTKIPLTIHNVRSLPILEILGVTNTALQASVRQLTPKKAELTLLLTEPVECEIFVFASDNDMNDAEREQALKDGERLQLFIKPL